MIITEIAHFKLRGARRDEIVDAVKLFTTLRPDSIDHLAFIASSTTWNYVSNVLTGAAYSPESFTTLLGYPIIVDDRFAMGRFEVVFTEPQSKNQFVLGLEFPEESFWVKAPDVVDTRGRLWELLKKLPVGVALKEVVIKVSPAMMPRINALARPVTEAEKNAAGSGICFTEDTRIAPGVIELWVGSSHISSMTL